MKTAIICDSLDQRQTTGINVFIRELLDGLRRVSADDEFILIHADPAVVLGDGGRFRDLLLPATGGELARNLVHLPRLLRALAPDVVHEPRHFPPLLPSGIPGVVTIHDLAAISHAPRGWKPFQVRFRQWAGLFLLLRHYPCVTADSRWTANEIHRILGIRRSKIRPILLGCPPRFRRAEPATIAAVRRRYDLPGPFWLNVGTLTWRKNQAGLVRAFTRMQARFPDVTLVISGRPADASGAVRDAIDEAALGPRIRLLSDVPDSDLAPLYSAADWFLLPSICEGFGFPVLEAQVCGTPVVCTRNSSLLEVGGDSVAPVEETADPAAIATAILQAIPRREALRAAGTANVARFSWDRCAGQYLDLYRELAQTGGRLDPSNRRPA